MSSRWAPLADRIDAAFLRLEDGTAATLSFSCPPKE